MELPQQVHARIERLSEEGNRAFDDGRHATAIGQWQAALELLPAPRADWQAWTWLCTAIGDACLALGNHQAARQALLDALNGPGSLDNPFVHFRLGQASLGLGLETEALDHLLKTYMLDGETLFQSDPGGPMALALLRARGLAK